MNLAGKWKVALSDGRQYEAVLPGTLDTNGIGDPDRENLDNRLTRLHIYEGKAEFSRRISVNEFPGRGKRAFLEAERARCLSLELNGEKIPETGKGTLSTPYVFEITQALASAREKGVSELEIVLQSDNSYPDMPRQGILTSSAATDETQTNWNGIIGYLRIRQEEAVFLDAVRIYPHGNTVTAEIEIDAADAYEGTLILDSEAFLSKESLAVSIEAGERKSFRLENIPLKEDIRRWDELTGDLYQVRVSAPGLSGKTAEFGVRDFGVNDQYRLTINGRAFFLRGEANCAVFPETGHPPMTQEEWRDILETYASYGVNCMRFHSWCPPSAAFDAADRLGMMMQPELSHWDWDNAFGTEESYVCYRKELEQILKYLANHPSFVMLSFGNELWTEGVGEKNKEALLDYAHELDGTRLYAGSSNGHYGQWGTDSKSDFYTSHDYKEFHLRGASTGKQGHINEQYPNARTNYDPGVSRVHQEGKPVFGFEVGQSEILPDFAEIDEFKGVTRAVNYEMIREKVEQSGRSENWREWVEATGETALIAYREEVEAALRTEGLSGLSLLGIQDFPGQGTALVGMLNSHLKPKPYDFARPERFSRFFTPVLPLVYLDKYTYRNTEKLAAQVRLANYGKTSVVSDGIWQLCRKGDVMTGGVFREKKYPAGGLCPVGEIAADLSIFTGPEQLVLKVIIGEYQNEYPVWVYPETERIGAEMQEEEYIWTAGNSLRIKITDRLDQETIDWLKQGGRVYLEPEPVKEKLPESIGGQFTTDFWSVGTFPDQEGGMGMVIDVEHPVFRSFPTQKHTNWQWWQMANGRPLILPEYIRPVITVPDSYRRLKHMGLLFEARAEKGIVMMSGMGLRYCQQYPETVSLLHAILRYMASEECCPKQEITISDLKKLVN